MPPEVEAKTHKFNLLNSLFIHLALCTFMLVVAKGLIGSKARLVWSCGKHRWL